MFDILQIRKYDNVINEINCVGNEECSSKSDDLNVYVDEEVPPNTLEILLEHPNCMWESDDENGNETICQKSRVIRPDNEKEDFCVDHLLKHKKWLDLLEIYVQDILKIADPIFIKKLNSDQRGWKTLVQENLGISRHLIKKFVEEKFNTGISVDQIVDMLDKEF